MLNKVSYLSKSASIVFAIFLVGMISDSTDSKQTRLTPGPHVDSIFLSK